jgi:hypothetical protein
MCTPMSRLEALTQEWRRNADLLERYGQPGAPLLRQCAAELESAEREAADEELKLTAAAIESGYSERRLRELIEEGRIPNRGRKGAPLLRRGDLPRKAKKRAASSYDAAADARSLLSKRGG